MRIVHIAYLQLRRYGQTRVSWARKLTNGLIKNDHFVEVFSDRDVAAFEAPFGIRDLGVGKANKRLLETVDAVEPDLVIAGHCDMIGNATLQEIRRRHPHVKIAHCNNDPLFAPDASVLEQRYDFIACSEVLEHLHEPLAECERLFGLLKPGALLAVMTGFPPDAPEAFAAWHYARDPTHVAFYGPRTFAWVAARLGAELEIPDRNVALLRRA